MDDNLQKYGELKAHLKEALENKKRLDNEYDELQQEIYDKETEYFSPTPVTTASGTIRYVHSPGNIIRGFSGFSKSRHHHYSYRHHHYQQLQQQQQQQQQQLQHNKGHSASNSGTGRNQNSAGGFSAIDPLHVGVNNKDRIFSLSSASFVEQLQQQEERLMNNGRAASGN